jgi:hypothetical protein
MGVPPDRRDQGGLRFASEAFSVARRNGPANRRVITARGGQRLITLIVLGHAEFPDLRLNK